MNGETYDELPLTNRRVLLTRLYARAVTLSVEEFRTSDSPAMRFVPAAKNIVERKYALLPIPYKHALAEVPEPEEPSYG